MSSEPLRAAAAPLASSRMPTEHQVGAALRAARKRKGLTLRDLELLSGMPLSHISSIETGVRRDPAFGTILRLTRALGITLDDLVARDAPVRASPTAEYVYTELKRLRRESADCIERIDEFLTALERAAP